MTIITTVADVQRIASEATGDAYWTTDPQDHDAAADAIGQAIWEDGHAAGLRSGDDWSQFLADWWEDNEERCYDVAADASEVADPALSRLRAATERAD